MTTNDRKNTKTIEDIHPGDEIEIGSVQFEVRETYLNAEGVEGMIGLHMTMINSPHQAWSMNYPPRTAFIAPKGTKFTIKR